MSGGKGGALRAGRPSRARKEVATLSSLADKGATVRVNFDLARKELVKLKVLAARQGRTVADIMREMVGVFLSKKSPTQISSSAERLHLDVTPEDVTD